MVSDSHFEFPTGAYFGAIFGVFGPVFHPFSPPMPPPKPLLRYLLPPHVARERFLVRIDDYPKFLLLLHGYSCENLALVYSRITLVSNNFWQIRVISDLCFLFLEINSVITLLDRSPQPFATANTHTLTPDSPPHHANTPCRRYCSRSPCRCPNTSQ